MAADHGDAEVGNKVRRATLPTVQAEVRARELGGGQMRKMTAMDAENKATEFIGDRYPRLKGIHFARTRREDNVRAL